jgi:hypothetical protein
MSLLTISRREISALPIEVLLGPTPAPAELRVHHFEFMRGCDLIGRLVAAGAPIHVREDEHITARIPRLNEDYAVALGWRFTQHEDWATDETVFRWKKEP